MPPNYILISFRNRLVWDTVWVLRGLWIRTRHHSYWIQRQLSWMRLQTLQRSGPAIVHIGSQLQQDTWCHNGRGTSGVWDTTNHKHAVIGSEDDLIWKDNFFKDVFFRFDGNIVEPLSSKMPHSAKRTKQIITTHQLGMIHLRATPRYTRPCSTFSRGGPYTDYAQSSRTLEQD